MPPLHRPLRPIFPSSTKVHYSSPIPTAAQPPASKPTLPVVSHSRTSPSSPQQLSQAMVSASLAPAEKASASTLKVSSSTATVHTGSATSTVPTFTASPVPENSSPPFSPLAPSSPPAMVPSPSAQTVLRSTTPTVPSSLQIPNPGAATTKVWKGSPHPLTAKPSTP